MSGCRDDLIHSGGQINPRKKDLHMPFKTHKIKPGSVVDLESIDAHATPALAGSKQEERAAATELHTQNLTCLAEMQYRLWAENSRGVLIVLQGMDTSGKDGTVRHVMSTMNPQGVIVYSFKKPTEVERAHDFLWRIEQRTPRHGTIVVFNRSHYEDVGVVRVHNLVSERVWKQRYDQINAFEDRLVASGITVLKFFLHITKQEQKKRLEARLQNPDRRWKFSPSDIEERGYWGSYMEAYSEALTRCNTPEAPWFVIPADRKWYRNYAISTIVRYTLEHMNPAFPKSTIEPKHIKIP